MTSIGLVVFGLVSLLGLTSLLPPIASRLRLPYSVLLALVGLGLGLIVSLRPDLSVPSPALHEITDALASIEVSSEAFLLIFLPTLLFETAIAIDVRRLLDDLAPVLTLAVLAVVICAVTVGFALSFASPFGLIACLLLGSIVATTDPAAVIGIFREVGVPKRLTTLVEGESLLNDAAAIALFGLLLPMLLGEGQAGIWATIGHFLVSFLGGGFAGFLMGRAACALLGYMGGWPRAEITLTIALAYLSFVIPEHYFHVSGVVSCVTAGLVLGSVGKTRVSLHTFEQMEGLWGQLGFWANSLIFLLAAMLVPRIMEDITAREAGYIAVVFFATLTARAIAVFGLMPVLTRIGLMQGINNRIKTVIVWGGMRGAISLALAMAVIENQALPADLRDFVATSVSGFVLATLFINATTLRTIVNFFHLNRLGPVARGVRDRAKLMTLTDIAQEIEGIAQQEGIDREVTNATLADLERRQSIARVEVQASTLMSEEIVKVALTVTTSREIDRCYELLNARIVDRRVTEMLLREAQRVRDAVRSQGRQAYLRAAGYSVRFSPTFRWRLALHRRFGFDRPLAAALADRFEFLMVQHRILSALVPFCRDRLQPLVGEEVTGDIIDMTVARADLVERSLTALKLQYPAYAAQLQHQFLARIARQRELMAYRMLAANQVLSGEVERELHGEVEDHWVGLDARPQLDARLSAIDLVQRVPIFRDLDFSRQQAIANLLKPQLELPDAAVVRRGDKGDSMYFIASGAVRVLLQDKEDIELGSGDFFGELALITGQPRVADVLTMGYCQLLALKARDFQRLLEQDAGLRARIEQVAQERLNRG
jgi:CPA1 family monovalent cation:H+ antiporter